MFVTPSAHRQPGAVWKGMSRGPGSAPDRSGIPRRSTELVGRARRVRSLAAAVLMLGASAVGCRTTPSPTPSSPKAIWFGDLGEPLTLSGRERQQLARFTWNRVNGEVDDEALPPRLASDRLARIVFVSVSDGRSPAETALGVGRGIETAAADAARALASHRRQPGELRLLKIDVVGRVGDEESVERGGVGDRGLQGLAFAARTRLAFLPEELVARRLVTREGDLAVERIAREARRRGARWPKGARQSMDSLTARRFDADSFVFDGRRVSELYRGHRRDYRPTPQLLRASVAQAASYLQRMVDRNGRFVYSYLPKQDTAKDDYNMVRHAGTAFSMLEAWKASRDPALLDAAERALSYLKTFIQPFGPPHQQAAIVAFRGKIKLGGVALGALAFATHARVTGRRTHLATAQKLCRYIAASQKPDGSFVHQRMYPSGQPRDFVSQYYPGEALLALVTVYGLDGDRRWLDVAERGMRYLIEVRDGEIPTERLVHDHWLLYAIEVLYRHRPEPLYLLHAMRIAEAIIGKQKRHAPFPDYIGSYHDRPRSTPVATRNEGLLAAYRLARDSGRPEMAERILAAVLLGVAVQLGTQLDAVRAMYLANPPKARGGFTRSYDNFEVRIDYVQHNISALLALIDALERSKG